jgi:hypothetical protein
MKKTTRKTIVIPYRIELNLENWFMDQDIRE